MSLSDIERSELLVSYKRLLISLGDTVTRQDIIAVKRLMKEGMEHGLYDRDAHQIPLLIRNLQTALIVSEEIGLKREAVIALLLAPVVSHGKITLKEIMQQVGGEVQGIVQGIDKTRELYKKNAAIGTENFRNLLLSFAEDIRVILIMIADRLYLMRHAKSFNEASRLKVAAEASYLYAPLSHRLGLYKIKSELEDLALKYQDREMYDYIAQKLNETKRARDKYIAGFIAPVEKKLKEAGLHFDIKGRTKSIHSIRNKLLKNKVDFESIYDLFAIRVVLDTSPDKEKAECWQVYSIITDMYQPNPQRLKDWLSVPKSNGYESLHITVMGFEGRWVEVQIRSKRMDEIAEKGLAAHWKYKGLKGESGLDEWMNGVRAVLENQENTPADLIRDFKMDLYDDEIFVFTPAGDLFKLPRNATVLDFAFAIHTKLGEKCVSARINGKNATIKHRLQSGDQVEIVTSSTQAPKQDWLSFVVTSKARTKIRQSLKEATALQVDFAKELLQRRFKNRKIEEDEAILMRLIRKMGYKTVTDFYAAIAEERLDVNTVIDQYVEQEKKEHEPEHTDRTAEHFQAIPVSIEEITHKEDVLVIDENLTGVEYKLAKCCHPIFGDEIFGFVSLQGIKIHRMNCPNAKEMFSRFGYRILKARWTGDASGVNYPVTLRITGRDDIGIVTNITSLISKETGAALRSIHVDSRDGLFQGNLTVLIQNTSMMDVLVKKIKSVKGVKQVERIN